MKNKFLIVISTFLLTLTGCGFGGSSSSSSASNNLTSEETIIYETLRGIGEYNFTVRYNHNGQDYADKYTKDYIYYDYYHDALAMINPTNHSYGNTLYYVGVHYDESTVEVFSPYSDEGAMVTLEAYTSFNFYNDTGVGGYLLEPSDIKYSDIVGGYYVDDIIAVWTLSGMMSHSRMSYMNAILLDVNEDNKLEFTPALLRYDIGEDESVSLGGITQEFATGIIDDIGTTDHALLTNFVNEFEPYSETLNTTHILNHLTATAFNYKSEVYTAKKYQNEDQGDIIMELNYQNNGNAVSLTSYEFDTGLKTNVYYGTDNEGNIVSKYVDGTNTVGTMEYTNEFEGSFSPATTINNLASSFYKIGDNLYRSFSTSTSSLITDLTFTDFGSPLYVDAYVENGVVKTFRFGFMEDGRDSDGDFTHLVVTTTLEDSLTDFKEPTAYEATADTPLIREALNYVKEGEYHAHVSADVDDKTMRDIYNVDGYVVDVYQIYSPLIDETEISIQGYYLSDEGDYTFFTITEQDGVYTASDCIMFEPSLTTLSKLEYFKFLNIAPEIAFKDSETGSYRIYSDIQLLQQSLLCGYYGSVSTISADSVEINVDSNNHITSYSYDFVGSLDYGTETVEFKYEDITLPADIKACIDEFVS